MNQKKKVSLVFWIAVAVSILLVWISVKLSVRLSDVVHLPDQGAAWYYWKLPEATFMGRLTAWGGFFLHLLSIWFIIYLIKQRKKNKKSFFSLNIIALIINLFFILLHTLQTHLWYDGLAQDVPVWTSQWSVIIMLLFIFILMYPRRGLFFGKKLPFLSMSSVDLSKKIHGFYISWALIYTFWFHPVDGGYGQWLGFFYMYLLFIQMSLIYTGIHVRSGWIVFLEVFVAFHGASVAIMKGQEMWTMFFFGFSALFVITQIYSFKINQFIRLYIQLSYLVVLLSVYAVIRGIDKIYEVTFIPVAEYGGTIFLMLFLSGISFLISNKKTEKFAIK